MCFFNSAEQAYLEQHEPYSTINYDFHEVFFQNLNCHMEPIH
jgi:hypothetical protein